MACMNETSPCSRHRRVHARSFRLAALVVAGVVAAVAFGALEAALPSGAQAAASGPRFRLAPLVPRFTSPVWVGDAGDGTGALLVVEQRGIVWRVAGARRTMALDLRRVVRNGGEQGLLSLAVDANFAGTHRVFVYLVRPNGAGQVRQYRFAHGRAVAGSGRVVIDVPLAPPTAPNHNGGQLWSLANGTLLLSIGDGGAAGDPNGNAQRLDRLMGKVLRITPRRSGGYAIPARNPFVGRAGARGEIYALGLRNPWRFSVDAATGTMWIGDVGQDKQEEVDVVGLGRAAAANFGWNRFEGSLIYDAQRQLTSGTHYVAPRITYSHASGGCSVTGGVVYRGPITALRGWYLYADYCRSTITAYHPTSRRSVVRPAASGIVHFGAGPRGEVYVASQQTGRIYRIAD